MPGEERSLNDPTVLPFVKNTPNGRAGKRRNFWAVKSSGDTWKDSRTGREFALAYIAWEGERAKADDYEGGTIIGSIISDIVAARDDSALVIGFFHTLVACSVPAWDPQNIPAYRQHYDTIDSEVERQMSGYRRPPKAAEGGRRNA